MSNLRNSQLLQQMQAHPLKSALAKALDVAETFAGDVQFLQLDKNLSQQGRQNAMQAKLRAAVRDLRDARVPLKELQGKLDAKRKAVAMPAFDPKDSVGFRAEPEQIMRWLDRLPRERLPAHVLPCGLGASPALAGTGNN